VNQNHKTQNCKDNSDTHSVLTSRGQQDEQDRRHAYRLAVQLRGLYETTKEAKPTLREWHQRADFALRHWTWASLWLFVTSVWDQIEFPGGLPKVVELAAEMPAWPEFDDLREDQPGLELLANCCVLLARLNPDGVFFLSCRTAGEMTGVHFTTAAMYLKSLCGLGIIEIAAEPDRQEGLATSYILLRDGAAEAAFSAITIPEPLRTPEFETAWAAWAEHCRRIGKALTPTSTELNLRKLAEMGASGAVRTINHCIKKGWRNLWEPEAVSRPAMGVYE